MSSNYVRRHGHSLELLHFSSLVRKRAVFSKYYLISKICQILAISKCRRIWTCSTQFLLCQHYSHKTASLLRPLRCRTMFLPESHSFWYSTRMALRVVHPSTLNAHSFEYVFPLDPQTGRTSRGHCELHWQTAFRC